MKLTEFNPHYGQRQNGQRDNVIFDCPICKQHKIAVPFAGEVFWKKTGEDFETISLSPSIHYNVGKANPEVCEVHFWVTNGEVIIV